MIIKGKEKNEFIILLGDRIQWFKHIGAQHNKVSS